MQISIPPQFEPLITAALAEGRYPDAVAAVADALQTWAVGEENRLALKAKIDAAEADPVLVDDADLEAWLDSELGPAR